MKRNVELPLLTWNGWNKETTCRKTYLLNQLTDHMSGKHFIIMKWAGYWTNDRDEDWWLVSVDVNLVFWIHVRQVQLASKNLVQQSKCLKWWKPHWLHLQRPKYMNFCPKLRLIVPESFSFDIKNVYIQELKCRIRRYF